jgi:ATP-dependent Lon protease
MPRGSPDPRAMPGYTLLLWVDLLTGRQNGSETILVPLVLGETLNAARRVLYNQSGRADAWERAGVIREVPPVHDEDDADPDPLDTTARLQEIREEMAANSRRPGTPSSAPAPVPAESAPPNRRRSATGHLVPIISAAAITERRKSAEQRTKLSSEERKIELRAMDDLLALGETRLVGLKANWRARIAQMRTDMPHLSKVIDRLEACCALSAFSRRPLRIPPLLLVGPPGVGKTHFANCVADLLGVPRFIYALESAETVSVLTGSEKHWWNAEPGQLFKLVVQSDFANPVIVLDELDKVSSGNHYKPANALHAVLEPATAKHLRDKCIDLVFDASHVVYIATANRLSPIDASLVSRFELFHIEAPEPRAAVSIARAIGQQVLRELRLTRRFAKPTGEVVQQLALLGSPRRMHKVLAAAVGRAVVSGRTRIEVADLLDTHGVSQEASTIGGREQHVQ